jgi:hypothetical protein
MNGDLFIRLAISALETAKPDVGLWQGDAQQSYQFQLEEIIWQLHSAVHEW